MNSFRKSRIVYISDIYRNIYITKIKNSKPILLENVNFGIFNIPVECVEVDGTNILKIDQTNMDVYLTNIERISNEEEENNTKTFIVHNSKIYCEISKLRFALNHHKKLYYKIRAQ